VGSVTPVIANSEAVDLHRLGELVRRYSPLVARRLRRLGVPEHSVDDAGQRVFWIASRKLQRIEAGVEGAFLLTTALRVASDVRRVEARRLRREVALDDETETSARLDEMLDLKRTRALLHRVLSDMPAELATVFIMSEAEGLTATEISHATRAPVGTVASRLRRARAFVQQRVRSLRHGPSGALNRQRSPAQTFQPLK
jgi:RNA polymerase sigma-70 factor, ECF subfamily